MERCLWLALAVWLTLVAAYLGYEAPEYAHDVAQYTQTCGSVKHCGCCGKCSNDHDYRVYVEMNETLTEEARSCALRNLFGDSDECFRKFLTDGCAFCWAENVRCTRKHCWFPCLMEIVLGTSKNTGDRLSKCFACDEHHCLDGFISCAGMSRRRAGVATDIVRDTTEVCNVSAVNASYNC